MNELLSRANHITYAIKNINLEYEKHFKVQCKTKQVTIINAFNADDFRKPKRSNNSKLKCVSFSQYIGLHCGLEQIFEELL